MAPFSGSCGILRLSLTREAKSSQTRALRRVRGLLGPGPMRGLCPTALFRVRQQPKRPGLASSYCSARRIRSVSCHSDLSSHTHGIEKLFGASPYARTYSMRESSHGKKNEAFAWQTVADTELTNWRRIPQSVLDDGNFVSR